MCVCVGGCVCVCVCENVCVGGVWGVCECGGVCVLWADNSSNSAQQLRSINK